MEKIDFASLIKQPGNNQESAKTSQNYAKNRALPDQLANDSTKSDSYNIMNVNNNSQYARLVRPARPKNEGIRIINDESPAPIGDAARKSRAENLHPIAVCLLFSVAKEIQSSNEDVLNEMAKLEEMEPAEQIRIWTGYAIKNGLDPLKIAYPFTHSSGKGFSCMSCQHIDMRTAHQPNSKRLYHWSCKKHHTILEAYHGLERVLIAPETCTDYQEPTSI
jgi:hypothetical protein